MESPSHSIVLCVTYYQPMHRSIYHLSLLAHSLPHPSSLPFPFCTASQCFFFSFRENNTVPCIYKSLHRFLFPKIFNYFSHSLLFLLYFNSFCRIKMYYSKLYFHAMSLFKWSMFLIKVWHVVLQ